MLNLPSLRRLVEEKQREMLYRVATRAIERGHSLNEAAKIIGRSPAWLSTLRQRVAAEGDAAFNVRRCNCGRKPQPGRGRVQQRAFLEVSLGE